MTIQADQLRKEAGDQNAIAMQYLGSLDPTKPTDAQLIGLLAGVKAVVLNQSATILDAIAAVGMSPRDKMSSRMQRLRKASLTNNYEELQAIEQEIIDEHRRKTHGSGKEDRPNDTESG